MNSIKIAEDTVKDSSVEEYAYPRQSASYNASVKNKNTQKEKQLFFIPENDIFSQQQDSMHKKLENLEFYYSIY